LHKKPTGNRCGGHVTPAAALAYFTLQTPNGKILFCFSLPIPVGWQAAAPIVKDMERRLEKFRLQRYVSANKAYICAVFLLLYYQIHLKVLE